MRDLLQLLDAWTIVVAGAPPEARGSGSVAALLAAAAHDLRQPLQGLKLLTGVVANEADAARRQQSTLRMDTSIGSLLIMLELLGEIARVESQGLGQRSTSFPLDDLLSALVAEIAPVVAGRGGTMTAIACGLKVHSDRRLLHDCIKGIVLNAFWLDMASQLTLSVRPGGEHPTIEVTVDRPVAPSAGPGRVFIELGYIGGGQPALHTGFGLQGVKHVAELLGLSLAAQPAAWGGTVFTLRPV